MQGQVLVVQKAPRTVDIPLLGTLTRPSMSQLRRTQRRHHRDSTKQNEIQMDKKLRSAKLRIKNKKQNVFDSESRSDLSFTVQKDTEVVHREVKRGTKINCDLKENQSGFSETRRNGEEHSEFTTRRNATENVV